MRIVKPLPMVATVFVALVFLSGCADADEEQPIPKFKDGQVVKMKAFGAIGMVVRGGCSPKRYGGQCYYSVRFGAMQLTTNTRIFGSDGPVDFAPIAIVHDVREFEMEPSP